MLPFGGPRNLRQVRHSISDGRYVLGHADGPLFACAVAVIGGGYEEREN